MRNQRFLFPILALFACLVAPMLTGCDCGSSSTAPATAPDQSRTTNLTITSGPDKGMPATLTFKQVGTGAFRVSSGTLQIGSMQISLAGDFDPGTQLPTKLSGVGPDGTSYSIHVEMGLPGEVDVTYISSNGDIGSGIVGK